MPRIVLGTTTSHPIRRHKPPTSKPLRTTEGAARPHRVIGSRLAGSVSGQWTQAWQREPYRHSARPRRFSSSFGPARAPRRRASASCRTARVPVQAASARAISCARSPISRPDGRRGTRELAKSRSASGHARSAGRCRRAPARDVNQEYPGCFLSGIRIACGTEHSDGVVHSRLRMVRQQILKTSVELQGLMSEKESGT
jgi:hypothetical protein